MTVSAAEASSLALTATHSTVTSGGSLTFTVTLTDRYGNLRATPPGTGFSSTVSSDTFSDSTGTFETLGQRTITATSGSVSGSVVVTVTGIGNGGGSGSGGTGSGPGTGSSTSGSAGGGAAGGATQSDSTSADGSESDSDDPATGGRSRPQTGTADGEPAGGSADDGDTSPSDHNRDAADLTWLLISVFGAITLLLAAAVVSTMLRNRLSRRS